VELVLVRHGIAIERDDPDCPDDAARWLTKEGAAKTREAMAGLRALGVEPDVLLASPLRRALETARIAAEALRFDAKAIRTTEALLPDGDAAALLREVAAIDAQTVLCCGHAPNLDVAIARAVGARAPFTALKKAGAACVALDSPRAHHGELVWLYPPAALRKLAR
jgi:phosphohistidine phosphatase